MHVAVAADHNGYSLRAELLTWLQSRGYRVLDLGAYQVDPDDDYPDFAVAAAQAVASGRVDRGIIACGSGVGACIAANKMTGVRACVCHDTYSARQGVEHDDMNVLCLGARVIGVELARELVDAFLQARFTGEERHQRRLNKVLAIEGRSSPESRE
ncbi:MAG: ribose 5-phosphate isomerase B [Chloroflexi bacterium]|nr:ribose 5-phosphate isomerase B [Chloroflexota bacterium]